MHPCTPIEPLKTQTLHLPAIRDQLKLSSAPIVIAVSGGSDSIALLHILSFLYPKNRRVAVYVDHGLRPVESKVEEKLVAQVAKLCGASFIKRQVDTPTTQREEGLSPEEAARNLRYQALEAVSKEKQAQCVAVGHTRDDQAEEVLLRLIRGSGAAGLSGMAERSRNIIRPLLEYTKATLRAYCTAHALPYCEDSSNNDLRFLRNRVRHDLLPALEKNYNQSIRSRLIQTSSILREEDKLLESLSSELFKTVSEDRNNRLALKTKELMEAPIALQRRIFEKSCWHMESRPSFTQIESLRDLLVAKTGTELHLSRGLRAIKERQRILFLYPAQKHGYRGSATPDKHFPPLTIPGPGNYSVAPLGHELIITESPYSETLLQDPALQVIDAAAAPFPFTLRHHAAGERFHPFGSSGTRKISRFLTDQKIAAIQKPDFPLLLSGKTILAIVGLRIDDKCRTHPNTLTCLTLQWKKLG